VKVAQLGGVKDCVENRFVNARKKPISVFGDGESNPAKVPRKRLRLPKPRLKERKKTPRSCGAFLVLAL
jgi:hypothetical protein